jgi:hypothetical protein
MKKDFRPENKKEGKGFPQVARSESPRIQRPNAGGYGIGCAARTTGGVMPVPSWRHTSLCASEGGSLPARPRGRAAIARPCHAFSGVLTSSRLWTSPHALRAAPPFNAARQSRLPVRIPVTFHRAHQINGAVEVSLWCAGVAGFSRGVLAAPFI